MVWHFAGIIQNSGIYGMLSRDIPGDPDLSLLVEAFSQLIPCVALGRISEAIDSLPRDVRENCDVRSASWQAIDEVIRDRIEIDFFDACETAVPRALAAFIMEHKLGGR